MDGWQKIVADYGPLVWRTCYRLLGHDADAEDCYQETFVTALGLAERETVRHWAGLLRRVATTRALDRLRRRQRLAGRETHLEYEPDGGEAGPVESVERDELVGRLREALTELPEGQARIFCLRFLEEMSYREIGKQLGMTTSAVGVQIHRARVKLKELLVETTSKADVKREVSP